jgi:hypothetical protein
LHFCKNSTPPPVFSRKSDISAKRGSGRAIGELVSFTTSGATKFKVFEMLQPRVAMVATATDHERRKVEIGRLDNRLEANRHRNGARTI